MTWPALAWPATTWGLAVHPARAWLVGALVVVGSAFLVAGTIGLLRFDTVYNRMHAVSKPTSVGVVAIFLAAFARFGPGGAGMPSLVGIVFLFLTVPAGTHMIARAAERMGVPFREGVTWPEPPGGDPTSGEAGRERPATEREEDEHADREDRSGDDWTAAGDSHDDEDAGASGGDDGGDDGHDDEDTGASGGDDGHVDDVGDDGHVGHGGDGDTNDGARDGTDDGS